MIDEEKYVVQLIGKIDNRYYLKNVNTGYWSEDCLEGRTENAMRAFREFDKACKYYVMNNHNQSTWASFSSIYGNFTTWPDNDMYAALSLVRTKKDLTDLKEIIECGSMTSLDKMINMGMSSGGQKDRIISYLRNLK